MRSRSRRALPPATAPVVLGLTAALVLLSAVWKSACLDARDNYRVTCYSDVLELWTSRGLRDAVFPYVRGRLVDGAPVDTFEYPVLTGVFVWASSLLADGRGSFLFVSTVLLLPFALLTAWLLHRMSGRRALLWAASPSMVLYALHNWDLLAVAAATAGLWSWWRGKDTVAAVLLGIGACVKVYPGLFLLPLAAGRLVRRDVAGAVRVLGAGGGTVVAINLPFALVGREGWAATYAFQSARAADSSSNSLWYWVYPHLATDRLNVLVPVLLTLALAVAVAEGVRRAHAEDDFPLVQVCGAVLVAFLLLNKVSSPQYTLWLLPFLRCCACTGPGGWPSRLRTRSSTSASSAGSTPWCPARTRRCPPPSSRPGCGRSACCSWRCSRCCCGPAPPSVSRPSGRT